VDFIVPHFKQLCIRSSENLCPDETILIDQWILKNLKYRYYIEKDVIINDSNSIKKVTRVGLEDSKEFSFFLIACPHLS